jgi:hypothetical protein
MLLHQVAKSPNGLLRKKRVDGQGRRILKSCEDIGLVVVEHLLSCKASNAIIARNRDLRVFRGEAASSTLCPQCRRPFVEEPVEEIYALSTLGRLLRDGNHWMTIWVTRQLVEIGVPLDSIIWEAAQANEEVDMLFGFHGRLWAVELKGSDFNVDHSRRFAYRMQLYEADGGLVVATGRVAQDAKKIHDSSLGRKGLFPSKRPPVLMVELENVSEALSSAFDIVGSELAKDMLKILGRAIGWDIPSIFKHMHPMEMASESGLLGPLRVR